MKPLFLFSSMARILTFQGRCTHGQRTQDLGASHDGDVDVIAKADRLSRVGDSHQGEIAGYMDYAEDQSMQKNIFVQAKHLAKVGTGSSFFDFLQQFLPFLLYLVHLEKILFDLFTTLAVKFTDPRDFLLELFIFPLLEQVYWVFFDEVRKCYQQAKQRHE